MTWLQKYQALVCIHCCVFIAYYIGWGPDAESRLNLSGYVIRLTIFIYWVYKYHGAWRLEICESGNELFQSCFASKHRSIPVADLPLLSRYDE